MVGEVAGAEVGAEAMAEVGVIPIPSVVMSHGCPAAGGRHPMRRVETHIMAMAHGIPMAHTSGEGRGYGKKRGGELCQVLMEQDPVEWGR